jgi:transposase
MVKKMANDGLTNRKMATMLGVSEGTIKGDKKALTNGHEPVKSPK